MFVILAASLFAIVAPIIPVIGLSCNICAESNLDEFGECSTLFKYNCDNYQKKHANNEKVYCRTTRNRSTNGTYTVVKECVAESVHYNTFPQKIYNLEKECDVVDIEGFEVAYCVCRDEDYCNREPIVKQFTAFENEHPEFFEEGTATSETTEATSSTAQESGTSESTDFTDPSSPSTRKTTSISPFEIPEEQQQEETGETMETRRMSTPSWSSPKGLTSEATSKRMPSGRQNEQIIGDAATGLRSSVGTLPSLQCMQCTQAGLADLNSDCQKQVVIGCQDKSRQDPSVGRPFCFTRQIISTRGQIGVEKMCVTERAVLEEFSDDGVELLRGIVEGDSESTSCKTLRDDTAGFESRFCICANSKCNQATISEQIALGQQQSAEISTTDGMPSTLSSSAETSSRTTIATTPTKQTPRPTTSMSSAATTSSISPSSTTKIASTKSSTKTTTAALPPKTTTEGFDDGLFGSSASDSEQPQPTRRPSSPTTTALQQQSITPVASKEAAVSCAVCLDVELKDPLADCKRVSFQNCGHQLRGTAERAFCLTRQTQNGKDAFIVEKSCVTAAQFFSLFPEERRKSSNGEVPIGCASTYNGYVNYCICEGQMCNRDSLAQQAGDFGGNNKPFDLSPQSTTGSNPSPPPVSDLPTENKHDDWFSSGFLGGPILIGSASTPFVTEKHRENKITTDFGVENLAKSTRPAQSSSSQSTLGTTSSSAPPPTQDSNSVRNRLEKWKAATESTMRDGSSGSSAQSFYSMFAILNALLLPLALAVICS